MEKILLSYVTEDIPINKYTLEYLCRYRTNLYFGQHITLRWFKKKLYRAIFIKYYRSDYICVKVGNVKFDCSIRDIFPSHNDEYYSNIESILSLISSPRPVSPLISFKNHAYYDARLWRFLKKFIIS